MMWRGLTLWLTFCHVCWGAVEIDLYPSQFSCNEGQVQQPQAQPWWPPSTLTCRTDATWGASLQVSSLSSLFSLSSQGVDLSLSLPMTPEKEDEPIRIRIHVDSSLVAQTLPLNLLASEGTQEGKETCYPWDEGSLMVWVCSPPPSPPSLPGLLHPRADPMVDDPCCNQSGTDLILLGECHCVGPFRVTATSSILMGLTALTASQVEFNVTGEIIFPSEGFSMEATEGIYLSAWQIEMKFFTNTTRMTSGGPMVIEALAGPLLLSSIQLSASDIQLTGTSLGESPGLFCNRTTLQWSGALHMEGNSQGGSGILLQGNICFLPDSAICTMTGTSRLGHGVELHGPWQGSGFPTSTSISGQSGNLTAIHITAPYTFERTSFQASCLENQNCSGVVTEGSSEVTFKDCSVEVVTTGEDHRAILFSTPMIMQGTVEMIGSHNSCLAMQTVDLRVRENSEFLVLASASNCDAAIGLVISGTVILEAGSISTIEGQVDASSVGSGLVLYGLVSASPLASSLWRGVASSPTATDMQAISIWGTIRGGQNTQVIGIVDNPNGVGVYLWGGSQLDGITVRGQVISSFNNHSVAIQIPEGAVISDTLLIAEVTTLSSNLTASDITWGIQMASADVSNSILQATISQETPRARGIDLTRTRLINSTIEATIQVGTLVAAVYLQDENILQDSTIRGIIPLTDADESGAPLIRAPCGVYITGPQSMEGSVLIEGYATHSSMPTLGILVEDTYVVGMDLTLSGYGTPVTSSLSQGIEIQESEFLLNGTLALLADAYDSIRFQEVLLTASTFLYTVHGEVSQDLPPDLIVNVEEAEITVSVSHGYALIIQPTVMGANCQWLISGMSSDTISPLLFAYAWDIGNCTVEVGSLAQSGPEGWTLQGTSQSELILHHTFWVNGDLTWQTQGMVSMYESLVAQGDMTWTGGEDTRCTMNGTVEARSVVMCSQLTVMEYLELIIRENATMNHVDCASYGSCVLEWTAQNLHLYYGIGETVPVYGFRVVVEEGIFLYGEVLPIRFLEGLDWDGPLMVEGSVEFNGLNVAQNLDIRGNVSVYDTLTTIGTQYSFWYGTITGGNRFVGQDETMTFLQPVYMELYAFSRVETNQHVDQLYAESGAVLRPTPGGDSDSQMDLGVWRAAADAEVQVDFYLGPDEWYSRLHVADLSSLSRPVLLTFDGEVSEGRYYEVMTWDSVNLLSLFECMTKNESRVALEEGTLCAFPENDSYSLVSTFTSPLAKGPLEALVAVETSSLFLIGNRNPVAQQDSCTANCYAGGNCYCCMNVLANDEDSLDDVLTVVWPDLAPANTTLWYTHANGTVCATVSLPSSSSLYYVSIVSSYELQDQYGATDTTVIVFDYRVLPDELPPSASASVSMSPSMTLSSSPSRSTFPSETASRTASSVPSESKTQAPASPSNSPSITKPIALSPTPSIDPSNSPLPSRSASRSASSSASISWSPSGSLSLSSSASAPGVMISSSTTLAPTRTASSTPVPSERVSPSQQRMSPSPLPSPVPSSSGSVSVKISPSSSPSLSTSAVPSSSPSGSTSMTPSLSLSASPSYDGSISARASLDPGSLAGPTSASASSWPSRSPIPEASVSSLQETGQTSAPISSLTAPLLAGCVTCEYQEVSIPLTGEDQTVQLTAEDGTQVVSLLIPSTLTDSLGPQVLSIQWAREREDGSETGGGGSMVQSAVVDITLMVDGQVITDLTEPLEICLIPGEATKETRLCLAYYDVDDGRWRCEDRELEQNEWTQWCGTTPHLTSFALLLGGSTGSSGEYFPQRTIAWISLGFVAGAIVVILLAIGAIEIRQQYKRRADDSMYRSLSLRMKELSS